MCYVIMVIGLVYGIQQVSSVLQFVYVLFNEGYELVSVFFYWEGVYNVNFLIFLVSDEYDLVCVWQKLNMQYGVVLNICVVVVFCCGIIDEIEVGRLVLLFVNFQLGFMLSGLGVLVEVFFICDWVVQF